MGDLDEQKGGNSLKSSKCSSETMKTDKQIDGQLFRAFRVYNYPSENVASKATCRLSNLNILMPGSNSC